MKSRTQGAAKHVTARSSRIIMIRAHNHGVSPSSHEGPIMRSEDEEDEDEDGDEDHDGGIMSVPRLDTGPRYSVGGPGIHQESSFRGSLGSRFSHSQF